MSSCYYTHYIYLEHYFNEIAHQSVHDFKQIVYQLLHYFGELQASCNKNASHEETESLLD